MTDVITASGLVKTYGKLRALDGLDLAVPEGTILGLLGPNGAGKTTAVRILTTLTHPDSGRATVAGIDVLKHPAAVRAQIGVAGQYAALDELLTGRENLNMIGRLYNVPAATVRQRTEDLLQHFELTEAEDRIVKTYSGGMRRRLDLGAALISQPPVVFLDEPTTGLDPQSRRQLWDVIRDLQGRGRTTLLTTHYMEEAERLCDRVAIIDQGRVIALGSPSELIARIGGEHVVEFAVGGDGHALDPATLSDIPSVSATRSEVDGYSLTVGEPHLAIPALLDRLAEENRPLARLTTRQASLEDVFVALTGRHLRDNEENGEAETKPGRRGRRKARA
jgi:ABC-2 type transport system ATP-binding protein